MPNRAPLIWCDMPPVAMTSTRSSPGKAATLALIARPSERSRLAVGSGWRTMFTAMGVTVTGQPPPGRHRCRRGRAAARAAARAARAGEDVRQPGEDPVVDRQVLADGQVELAADELLGEMQAPPGVALQVGQVARPPALVGLPEPRAHADRQGRVVVQVEVVEVVVVHDDEVVGREALEQLLDPPRAVVPGLPARAEPVRARDAPVVLQAHGRGVRDADPADHRGHVRRRPPGCR